MLSARLPARSFPRRVATATALLTALATLPVLGAGASAGAAPAPVSAAPANDIAVPENALSVDFDAISSTLRRGKAFDVSGTVRSAAAVLAARRAGPGAAPVSCACR